METVEFKQQNVVYAEDQKDYRSLPVYKNDFGKGESNNGIVTSCYRLSFWERIRVLFTGRVYFQVVTFNEPLQPQRAGVDFKELTKEDSDE